MFLKTTKLYHQWGITYGITYGITLMESVIPWQAVHEDAFAPPPAPHPVPRPVATAATNPSGHIISLGSAARPRYGELMWVDDRMTEIHWIVRIMYYNVVFKSTMYWPWIGNSHQKQAVIWGEVPIFYTAHVSIAEILEQICIEIWRENRNCQEWFL